MTMDHASATNAASDRRAVAASGRTATTLARADGAGAAGCRPGSAGVPHGSAGPRLADIEGEILIGRPMEDVFDFVADERNEPLYNPLIVSVEKLTAGPVGPGTRYWATTRAISRTIAMTIETTGYKRPLLLASSTQMSPMSIHGTLTFEPVPDGTWLRWSWQVHPHGLLRLLTPAIIRRGRRQELAAWASLKRYLEAA
jgi:Polyketide cyclase / dehydrase and lipid transport